MYTARLISVIVAVSALTGIATTLARAAATLPNYLPEATPTSPIIAISSSGASDFGSSALEVVSAKSKGTAEGNSLKLGSFQLALQEAKNKLTDVHCTGLSTLDGTGIILIQGTFHVRHYNEGTLKTAAIFLLLPLHFSCGPLLVIELGCLAGELTPQKILTKTLTVTLTQSGRANKVITILKEELNGEEACQLLFAASGSATFALGAFESEQVVTGFTQGGSEIAMLIMPL